MMRNMKYSMTFGIALVCVMLFTACNDILEPPETQTPAGAYGRIRISFAGEEAAAQTARTVLPSTVFYQYTYTFIRKGEQNGVIKAPGNDGFFSLEVGSYTVAVQAFTGNAASNTLAATGVSSEFNVGPGSNNPVEVVLTGVGAGAHGEFSYTITYPAGATAEITLHKWPGLDTIALNPVNVTQGNGKTQTLQLETGSYLLTVLVSKTGLYAGISEAIHIYPSLATAYTKNYVDNDFLPKVPGAAVGVPTLNDLTQDSITINLVDPPGNGQTVEYGINTSNIAPSAWQAGLTFSGLSHGVYYLFARSAGNDVYTAGAASTSLQVITGFIVTNTDQWNTALTAIRNGGSGTNGNLKTYTIMVFGNVTVPGSTATGTSFGSVQYIAVTLKGSGTLSLNSSGSILYLDSNQTFIIDDENLTLQGRSSNSYPVMYVYAGRLELKNGAISGNTKTSTNSYTGGGVYVYRGNFTMSGGTISGNTAGDSNSSGGGVYLASGGTFTMSGGTISGNTAGGSNSSGGGVYLAGGAFIMSGGTISGNAAGYRGGGVYLASGGAFTMTGGIVYGSDVGFPLANTAGSASSGAALYVVVGGTARYGDGSNILPHTDNQSSYTNNNIVVVGSFVTFNATFNANGGSGTVPSPITVQAGSSTTLPDGDGLYRTGYTFGGWNTNTSGTGTNYNAGSSYTPTGNITLYARWYSTVTFDANGATGGTAPASLTANAGSSITLPGVGNLTRTGYTSGGWNTNTSGTGTNYNAGSSYTPTGNITLYAKWDGIAFGATLIEKLNWLSTNAVSDTSYVLEVNAGESLAPQTLSYGNRSNIEIILRGIGAIRTISLSNSGAMFTVDSGITLVLDNNITLQGRNVNSDSLVRVNSGGTLIMKNGSIITGNTAEQGGGVMVDAGGTFTMNGGKISGNTILTSNQSLHGGGGVYVKSGGTFTMNGGEISGNTASEPHSGGGVVVRGTATMNGEVIEAGTFTMNGGTISGNTAQSGGGVFIWSGTFTMSGTAKISNNYASDGGGVSMAWGTFTINGGEISGHTTLYGGGIHIGGGTLMMNGGTISGNTASGSGDNSRGGGVCMQNEGVTFTMSGGEISGNTSSYGGGVYANGTFTKTGGTITGYASDTVNGNVVKDSSGTVVNNRGHAVYGARSSNSKRKETTAGPEVNLYCNGSNGSFSGGWDY